MADLDPAKLSDTLIRLLSRGGPDRLDRDADGWVAVETACVAVSRELSAAVAEQQLLKLHIGRLEISGTRIRMSSRRANSGAWSPDILFHATTADGIKRARKLGRLTAGQGRMVFLSSDEGQAWRAAHRLRGPPKVVAVDTLRARKSGVRFTRNRGNGLFQSTDIPLHHLLSLRKDFAEQMSAGGIPIRRDPDGQIRMALIKVSRRSGHTWEVAKGKSEDGETPEMTAIREVQEEMGIDVPFEICRFVGNVRYGFLAPGGLPRLKNIFLYLIEPQGPMDAFNPSTREGIGDVGWFTPDEACRAVTHTSLQPLMRKARDLVARYGTTPESPAST